MGIHDRFADKAAAMGRTAAEFHAAAYRHAKSAIFWAIIGGGAWWFIDWIWALIPAFFGAISTCRSVSSTMIEVRLENREVNK